MLKGQAATVALTLADRSVAVPLKLMVAGVLATLATLAAVAAVAELVVLVELVVLAELVELSKASEPLKASGASAIKGIAILDASSVTAPSLMTAGEANVSSSQLMLPPRTAMLAISTFHGLCSGVLVGIDRGTGAALWVELFADCGAVLGSFLASFCAVAE